MRVVKVMSNEIRIRKADSGDITVLVGFNQAMARETEAKDLNLSILTSGVQDLLKNDRHGFYLVAVDAREVDGEAIGSLMVTYEWSDWRNGVFWWIQSVYIKPEFRRQGVYRRLYEFVKELASADENVCGFRLYVERENRIAQRTYEQLGMRESHYVMYEELLGERSR
jgi:ribosomal protein S18 acetylase RimI-like enzyme